MENKRTLQDLKMKQALPLELKVKLTQQRIREWVNEFGIDGVYVSFSGGKDSTVLLHIAREMYGEQIKGVFVNTGLEYPEIVAHVKTFPNIDIIRPKMNFKKVIEKYGYPFISKEISEKAFYARKYLDDLCNGKKTAKGTIKGHWGFVDLVGINRRDKSDLSSWELIKKGILTDELLDEFVGMYSDALTRAKMLFGTFEHTEKGVPTGEKSNMFDCSRYKFLIKSPYKLSNQCCMVMKKSPMHAYCAETGRNPITAQMADESRARTQKWLQNGCNGFNMKKPISNPMSFWTEQDILLYIKTHNIKLCSIYGDIVVDQKTEEVEGQMTLFDWEKTSKESETIGLKRPKLKTTGCSRTGCMFCGYGAHCRGDERFLLMKETHPKQYAYIMKPWEEGGLGYKDVIDWLNENGDLNIKY